MDKTMLGALSNEQKTKMAVAYLCRHRDEAPPESLHMFDVLMRYENSLKDVFCALNEAQNTMQELNSNREQLIGSVNAVVEVISPSLPADKIQSWCEKYESQILNTKKPDTSTDVSIAGSAAKANIQPE